MTKVVTYRLAGRLNHMSIPVSGVTVRLFDYWTIDNSPQPHFITQQITDKKGEFNFSVRAGNYLLEIIPNNTTRFARNFIDVKVTNNCSLPITLKSAYVLSGIVQFSSGLPIADSEIVIRSPDYPYHTSELIDKKGNYSFTLAPGKYKIGIRHKNNPGYNLFLSNKTYSVDLNKDAKFDLTLPAMLKFSGAVFDDNNRPVPDVKVKLNSEDAETLSEKWQNLLSIESKTNSTGQFEFSVFPGNYNLELIAPISTKLAFQKIGPIRIEKNFSGNYHLQPGHSFTGQITCQQTDCGKLPVLISLTSENTHISQLIDDSRQYGFVLPTGNYQICALPQPDSLAEADIIIESLAPYVKNINLDKNSVCNIALDKGVATKGRLSGPNNQPVSHQLILFYYADGDKAKSSSSAITSCWTNERGAYEICLAPGKYWLLINGQLETAKLIEVGENSVETESKLEFNDTCLVTFEINSAENNPVEYCLISWQSYDELMNQPQSQNRHESLAYTDETGVCKVVIPSGIYSFYFEPRPADDLQDKQIRQLSINQNLNRKIMLVPKER